jgi:hypothetical protein
MVFLTRWFGVTENDAERCPAREKADIDEIAAKSLLMQKNAATAQRRSLCRGTHASGVCVRGQFEIFDVAAKRAPELAARLAKGIFAKPGVYLAVVRFANADSNINSDFKPDVRSLSFSADLTRDGTAPVGNSSRQDFSMQNATTLPINDSPAFLATIKVLTASNPVAGLWSLPFIAGSAENQALSAAPLLEHRSVSSRAGRCCKVFCHTISGQFRASSTKK